MTLSSATKFYKQANCPASETLLKYYSARLAAEQRVLIAKHLDGCDFCGAELQLLVQHPPRRDYHAPKAAKMPLNLRYLAEALLARDTLSLAAVSFAGVTIYEKAPLTLTDA